MTLPLAIPGKLVNSVYNRVLADDVTEPLLVALRDAGIDVGAIADAYPRATWYRGIEVSAATLFASDPPPQQLRKLGRHIISVLQTRNLIKGPWLSMAKLMGPRRALKQAADLGAKNSPIRLEVEEKGNRELQITVDEDQQVEFLMGLLESLVSVLGGKEPKVVASNPTPGTSVFTLSWR